MPPSDTETGTELEFRLTDPEEYPFVRLSSVEECRLVLEDLVPQSSGDYLEFFRVTDGSTTRIVELAEREETVEARLVDEYDDGSLFEFRVSEPEACVAVSMVDEGAFPRELWADRGEGRLVADVLPPHDARDVIDAFKTDHPSLELVAKRERTVTGPLFLHHQLRSLFDEVLTDRQREVLTTAYLGGYFEQPREVDSTDLADRLGITQSTFSQHVRTAQCKIISMLYEEHLLGTAEASEDRRLGS